MLTFFLYLMKSVLCLALFYPFYMVLLSRETFHRFNRMALISILVASVIIPACRITTEEPLLLTQLYQRWENWLTGQDTETVAVAYVDWAEMEMTAMPITEEEVLTPASTFSLLDFLSTHWSDLLFMLYVGGILFLLGRHVVSIFRLFALLRQGKLQRLDDGTRLYLHNRSDIAPFSWMKYIVISEADYRENGRQIVAHEQAHISNGHSWDLLLVEVCLLAQWFNPAAWLIRQELQNIHEYEADDTVLRRGINAKEYQLLIIKKAVGARLYSLANSLNHSSLKKRLTMMMKRKSNPWARLKYLYVLPLAAISMVAFAHTEAANNSNGISEAKGTEVLANNQIPGVKSSENEKILIVVDGKLTIQETGPIDWTNEDLAKHIGVTPEEIAQIEVIKKPEILAQWNIPGATGAILVTTKKGKATDENPVVVVHVNDKGEYSYGYKGETMEEASLERITNFIEAVQLDRIDKQKEGPLLRVSLSVDKNAPVESVEKLKVAIRESHISKLEYNMASEQKEALIDYLKLNGQPRLNEESNAIEWGSAEEVFMVVENMPEFPGGTAELMKFLAQNIKYPVEAQKENVQGRVVVQFVVSKTGKITDPTIARSVSPELDAEAIRVVKAMPNWKPGTQRGQAVNVKFNIPISFRLDGAKGNEGEEESDIRVVGYNKENIKAVYSEPREEVSASTSDDEVFQVVENMPEFPGGTEELIKKLPGAQMGENGKITINGKEVKKISMNGKDFYDGDQVVNTNKSMQTKVTAEGSVKDNNEIFEIVENMPEFPGGMAELMKFLQQNIKYPEQAQKDSIQGRVIVQFTIKKTGEVSSTTVVRSVSPELDAEAIRVVNAMPLWTPGEQKGEPVNVKFTLPIQFRLTGETK